MDPAPKSSSDRLQSRATPDPAWTRWTAGTRLLPNVELSFSSPDKCPDPTEALVFGWDPGAKYAAVISCLNPQDPHRRYTLTISRGFLWRPALLFRDLVDKKKKDTLGPDGLRTIKNLEAAIPSYSLDNLPAFIRYMSAPQGTSPLSWRHSLNFIGKHGTDATDGTPRRLRSHPWTMQSNQSSTWRHERLLLGIAAASRG